MLSDRLICGIRLLSRLVCVSPSPLLRLAPRHGDHSKPMSVLFEPQRAFGAWAPVDTGDAGGWLRGRREGEVEVLTPPVLPAHGVSSAVMCGCQGRVRKHGPTDGLRISLLQIGHNTTGPHTCPGNTELVMDITVLVFLIYTITFDRKFLYKPNTFFSFLTFSVSLSLMHSLHL